MKTTNTTANAADISTVEAIQINAKVAASAATVAIGYVAGAFSSMAISAKNEAAANPDGWTGKALTRTIREHYVAARQTGFEQGEGIKDAFSFDDDKIK